MSARVLATALAALAATTGGCRLGGPATIPLRGEPPDVVAVWPRLAAGQQPFAELLLPPLDEALRPRGYRVVVSAVAARLLEAAGTGADVTPASAGPALMADAVLELQVRDFEASGDRPLRHARWDLEWRLWSTRGGGVLWSFVHRGSYRAGPQAAADPHRPLDAEPDIVPIGGGAASGYRDAGELLAVLHRDALARLPAAPAGRAR